MNTYTNPDAHIFRFKCISMYTLLRYQISILTIGTKIIGLLATRKRNTRETFLQVRTLNERAIHFEEISVDFASVVACYWPNDDLHCSR